jgi:chemotaxis signal transduction protein
MVRFRPRARPDLDAKTREILADRAARLRAPPPQATDEHVVWIAEFPVGDDWFALPLDTLRAVVSLRRVTPIPLARPHVIGILRFQGRIASVLSLASLLGITGWAHDPAVLLVVDAGAGHVIALDCEQIPKPTTLPSATLERARAEATRAIVEISVGTRLVHYIELDRLLDRTIRGRGGG